MTPRRLLVVRPDRVGDVLISSSCLPALRARFPETDIVFAARPAMEPLFANHPLVRFLALPDPALPFFQRLAILRRKLAAERFDCVVSLHPYTALYATALLEGIPWRIGYPKPWVSWTLTDCVPNRRPEHLLHEAVYNFDPLSLLDVPLPEKLFPSIDLPQAARESLRRKLRDDGLARPYLCLHLGAFSPVARWPVSHFVSLARRLRDLGFQIVLIGHDAEDASHVEFRALAGNHLPCLDLAGRLDLGELGWLLRDAACLVTRDTGPSHLAAAVGSPVVVLFGRVDAPYGPRRWAPLGERVHVLASDAKREKGEAREEFWQRAFASIPVEAVEAAVLELVAK